MATLTLNLSQSSSSIYSLIFSIAPGNLLVAIHHEVWYEFLRCLLLSLGDLAMCVIPHLTQSSYRCCSSVDRLLTACLKILSGEISV
jgi:hypothetical protein